MTVWEFAEPVNRLRGVGAATARDLATLGVHSVLDLLLLTPRTYEDRRTPVDFGEATDRLVAGRSDNPGTQADARSSSEKRQEAQSRGNPDDETEVRGAGSAGVGGGDNTAVQHTPSKHSSTARESVAVNTTATVLAHDYIGGRGGKQTLKVILTDESGNHASLVCFGRNFLAKKLAPGTTIRLYGPFSYRYGELQSTTFEFAHTGGASASASGSTTGNFDRILPVYHLSGSLTQGGLRRLTETALACYGAHVISTLPDELRLHNFSTSAALQALHFPDSIAEAGRAREALAFEEFLLLQLRIVRAARLRRETTRPVVQLPRARRNTLIAALPFTLTEDQQRTLEEIHADMESPHGMHRLLQGDVGSGKTMVALLSAVSCIEAGHQAALMAPTELLARQHADNAARFLEPVGVRTAFLTGSLPRTRRTPLLEALTRGDVDLVVGTHSLFSNEVSFSSLKLAIIDEQQRFGVLQRAAFQAKGTDTDVLVTTATPIPRTLALGLFGDLDISTIRTMPPGRKPVRTHLARQGNEEKVYERVRSEITAGRQAYFVYPLIDEGTSAQVKNATEMQERLAHEVFPEARIGLVHSRIPEETKEATMAAFVRGELDILVATSVVEVGVDVANATCMVIEHAERFGLSALHQLRGRVGRSNKQSYCFLVYSEELTEAGKERMRVMYRTTDGFEIAEEDLRIRGPGNVAGTRQSGYVKLYIADLAMDFSLLRSARNSAEHIISEDIGLLESRHQALRAALTSFSQRIIEG